MRMFQRGARRCLHTFCFSSQPHTFFPARPRGAARSVPVGTSAMQELRRQYFDKNRDSAQRLVKSLVAASDGQGLPWSIESRLWIAALCAWGRLSRYEVVAVIIEMKAMGKPCTLEEFELGVSQDRVRSDRAKALSRREWTIFVPFPAAIERGFHLPTRVEVLGVAFEIVPWNDVEGMMPRSDASPSASSLIASRTRQKLGVPTHALRAISIADAHDRAWQNVQPAFDTLRGLIEFEFGQHRLHDGQVDQPTHHAPHPRWLIAFAPGVAPVVDTFRHIRATTDERSPTTSLFIAKVAEDARLLSDNPAASSSKAVLADAMRLYGQARDADSEQEALLSYWQMAENLLFPLETKRSGDTKHIAKRLAFLQQPSAVDLIGLEDVLAAVGQIRNDIVHRGTSGTSDLTTVDLLKVCVENALHWLRNMLPRLATRQTIEDFFSLGMRHANDRKSIRAALVAIRSWERIKSR